MKIKLGFMFLLLLNFTVEGQKEDSLMLRKIYDFYLTRSSCYSNLRELCTKVGGRLSGSPQAEKAVEWAKKAMYAAGADTVILQPCMVPHWKRGGKEVCQVITKHKTSSLACCALGSSIGTGRAGINAQVIEVKSFDELEKLGEENIKGKIVFYNVFFDQRKIRPGSAYGETVKYRAKGASYAARYGAIASVVRSMTSVADNEPHTGNMSYDTTISTTKIPALALSYEASDKLSTAIAENPGCSMFIRTDCENLAPVLSYNVVGQLNGTEKPNDFLSAGGHLDSWDNGQGAHDDGAGVVQTMELMALFKHLGIKPRHSLRAVAFMNEENGLAGGQAYADYAVKHKENHLAALETDAGGYTPRYINADTLNGLYNLVARWKDLFSPYLIEKIQMNGGGADLIALEKLAVPCIGYEPDTQRYFDIHHTAADTFDKINKRELELGAATIGALFYLLDKYYY